MKLGVACCSGSEVLFDPNADAEDDWSNAREWLAEICGDLPAESRERELGRMRDALEVARLVA